MTLAANVILFPPGRIVQGDLYAPQDKDMQGNLLTTKNGPNAGKTRVNYYFAVAVPKTRGAWWEETWGAQALALANALWPRGETQQPKFSWKIEDGDSQTPNEANRKNADREGHPGCWILKFGSGFATKVFDEQGAPLLEANVVKPGFWVEVLGSINSNENAQKPGIFLNHNMVAFRGRDKEIVSGPDPRAVGFGRAAVPAHVSMAPTPGANLPPMTPPAGAPPANPAPPAFTPPAPSYTPPAATPPAPTAVLPNPGFIAPPVPGAAASIPPAPSAPTPPAPPAAALDPLGAPAGYRMANVAGPRYEGFRSQNWTDAQLVQAGHMVKL